MAFLRDDLDDYKLNTEFYTRPDIVSHTSYRADWAHGKSRVAVEERWAPQKPALGAGSFGVVRLERRQNADVETKYRERAVKQLRKFDLTRMKVDFRKELEALTKFSRSKFAQSQAFVKFLGWFEDDDHIFIAMEYFPHGTLDIFLTPALVERDAQTIALQLLEGLRIMHEEQFTHRDLKPQNIFVVQHSPHWWVKIGDFGISKRVASDGTALRTSTGTPKYLAPEIFHYVHSLDEESDCYTNAVDIWSFACVVYEMLTLQVPFVDWPRNLVAFCKGGRFPDGPLIPRTSYAGIQFVKSLLVPFPAQRPTARETLESPWLQPDTINEFRKSTILGANEDANEEPARENRTTVKQGDATHNFVTAKGQPGTPRRWWESPRYSTANLGSQSNGSLASFLQDQGLNVEPQQSRPSSGSSALPLRPGPEARIDSSLDTKHTRPPEAEYGLSEETIRPSHYRTTSEKGVAILNKEEPAQTTPQSPEIVARDKMAIATSSSDGYYCDNCNDTILRDYVHCSVCNEGDFALCLECLEVGNHCSVPEHWMVKRHIKSGEITSSVTETERAPWTLCNLNGEPDSKLPPPTKSRTLCTVNRKPELVEKPPMLSSWYPPQRRKRSWDHCCICGKFPVDNPPRQHVWELHGTGDISAPQGTESAELKPSMKVWMKQPSEEESELHNAKLNAMGRDMAIVFAQKVNEKEGNLQRSEGELYEAASDIMKRLEQNRADLEAKIGLERRDHLRFEVLSMRPEKQRKRWRELMSLR